MQGITQYKYEKPYATDSKLGQGTRAYQCAEEQCGMFAEWRQELGDTVQQLILWYIPGLARLWQ